MQTVQSKSGRFIRMKDNVWSITPSKACQLKIAHAFRYHIRTEFSQSKSLPISSYLANDIMNARSGPVDQISYHIGIVEDVKAKLSWLHAQQVASELTRSYSSIGNNIHLSPNKSNFDETGDNVDKKLECESPYTAGIHHNVVSPYDERKVARCDGTGAMEDRHVSIFPPERMNAYPLWMNELNLCYDARERLPRDIPPSTTPNFGGDIGMRPFRPFIQQKLSHGDSAPAHTYESVPVVTEANGNFCYPISERASTVNGSYFIGNMNSFDYYEQRYGLQNLYQTINSANGIDTPTRPGRRSMDDSNVMASEIQADFIDHGESSLISTMDGAFDVLPLDLTHDLDPLPM